MGPSLCPPPTHQPTHARAHRRAYTHRCLWTRAHTHTHTLCLWPLKRKVPNCHGRMRICVRGMLRVGFSVHFSCCCRGWVQKTGAKGVLCDNATPPAALHEPLCVRQTNAARVLCLHAHTPPLPLYPAASVSRTLMLSVALLRLVTRPPLGSCRLKVQFATSNVLQSCRNGL